MKQIAPNVYVSTDYPSVNIGCIVAPSGVIAVDAPTLPRDARAWRQEIAEMADRPIIYTVLTDVHPHRLFSASLLGAPIVASQTAYAHAADYSKGFWRSVVRRLKRRYPEEEDTLADAEIELPEILFSGTLTLHKGGADVTVARIDGGAPGSAWVDMRVGGEGVLFVGDALVVGRPPIMDETPDTRAWLDTLTTLRRPRFEHVTLVPGRGPISDQEATRPLSEYIRVARRRVRSLHRAGRPRDDVVDFVDELISTFSLSDQKRDRFRRRVRNGLKHVYDELEPEENE